MLIEEYCWNRSKAIKLYGKLWAPDEPMSALIIMVHGIGEHSGRYEEWAKKMAAESFGFFVFDLRGHGRSSGKKGHTSCNLIISDLKMMIQKMNSRFPDVPIILYGHSMGGNIVLNYALTKIIKVKGIIVSSPWIQLVHPPSSWLMKIAKIAGAIMPSFTINTGIKANMLSHNNVGGKSSKTDPLMHKKISLGLFCDLTHNGEMILRYKHRLNTPLLLMHGTSDQLTSCQGSRTFASNAGPFTEFRQWNGMRHELHNDTNKEIVFQYICRWISRLIERNGSVQNSNKVYQVA